MTDSERNASGGQARPVGATPPDVGADEDTERVMIDEGDVVSLEQVLDEDDET